MPILLVPLTFVSPLLCLFLVHVGNTNHVFALDFLSGALTVSGQLDRENPLYSAGFTLTVQATDGDDGTFGVVRYSFGDDPDQFSLDPQTGWVTLQAALDYELMRRFTLTVLAIDGGGEVTTGRIRINVLDINDNAPLFQKEMYVGSLRENEEAIIPVARVRATDDDSPPNNILTYTMTSISAFPSYFSIIMVEGFAGATVLLVNATDLDASREFGQASLIYSLEGSTQFRLNSRSGEITTTALLDRESKSEYILIVRAVDGGVGPQQKTGIATVLAYDPDNGDNGTVVYSISPENPFYTINRNNGKIRTSGVTLDRESTNTRDAALMRTIIISAVDRGTPPLQATSSTTVFVNLQDLNDNDPTFLNLPFVAEVPEGLPIGSSVYKVLVEDPDEGQNGFVTMALQVGMPRLDFFLNTSSGILSSTTVLDREQIGQYQLRIIAYDAGKFPRTSTATLTVSVLDVNDETPTFNPRLYNVSLKENVPRDYIVARLL
ncbi:hypothetical protein WMY93_018604 [Mugilogobius chulae]|uniref:Cadherin domain-containing protein n=1 Tax=Mugilogobius chulae TaxID=88201 RepID=A0AAW0NJE0_9GOBI